MYIFKKKNQLFFVVFFYVLKSYQPPHFEVKFTMQQKQNSLTVLMFHIISVSSFIEAEGLFSPSCYGLV